MNSDESLLVELARIVNEEARSWILSVSLPPGRIINTDEGQGRPGLWMTTASVPPSLWAEVHTDHSQSGLWPLLLSSLRNDAGFRPWQSGELDLERITSLDLQITPIAFRRSATRHERTHEVSGFRRVRPRVE
jgi:hypothetical protein